MTGPTLQSGSEEDLLDKVYQSTIFFKTFSYFLVFDLDTLSTFS